MSELRRRSPERPSELSRDPAGPVTRYEFGCPRCAGRVNGLEDAGAVICSYCGAAFFSTPGRDTGWLLHPRIQPGEAAAPAKTWLRTTGRRVRRLEEPRGFLLPVYWARGRFLRWELAQEPTPLANHEPGRRGGASGDPDLDELWEARFSIEAYAHTFPAHALSSLIPGRQTRLESVTLSLLEPDALPAGFRWVEPSVPSHHGELLRDAWLARRAGAGRGPVARVSCGTRFHLVAFPVVVIPFCDETGRECEVAVDAVAGLAIGEIPEAHRGVLRTLESSPKEQERRWRPPHLVPLECGTCGSALAVSDHDRLYGCGNCGSAWELAQGSRRSIRQWTLEGRAADRWLPFWLFGGDPMADRLPDGAVLVPAYPARHPEAQLHLAAHLTRTPPVGSWAPVSFEILGGASVGSAEARAWRWAVQGALSRSTLRDFLKFVRSPTARDTDSPWGLVWIPFREVGGDLVEPRTEARTREVGTRPWDQLDQAA